MKHNNLSKMLIALALLFVLVACGGAETPAPQAEPTEAAAPTEEIEPTEVPEIASEEATAPAEPTIETMMRDSGLLVTVQDYGDVVVHSLTAPEQAFANSTHIIETPNSLVLFDTQFLLPMALDYRAYADSLGKPIDRLIISHAHPDHFLGGEAFADVDMYVLAETADLIAANGQAEVDEKQADFGDAIASTFVVPEVLEPGTVEIDGVTFEFSKVMDAEAEVQLVTTVPDYDVVYVGDIVYSGVHLILAGAPPTWIEALENLKAASTESTVVLAGHGLPGTADLYDENIAWLAKAGELLSEGATAESFKSGLVEAFPDLGMDAAIDFVTPFLFPEEAAAPAEPIVETMSRESGLLVTVQDYGDVVVHSLTAPEQVFADSTHIIEMTNSLVLIDTQFLLPMALDYRAYADSLGKPIERLIITHAHPDHFLGSEVFADVDIYALAEVADSIEANGQAEVDEKQADFGEAIAGTFVVPMALEPGSAEIDRVTFQFEQVDDAEADIQLVVKVPEYGIVAVGDIVYSGIHLILAGGPPTWTEALENLKADSDESTIVLAGHGVPGTADLYDENIAWLAKAGELLSEGATAESFKNGLVEAFPDLGMDTAIDFVLPFLFPEEASAPAETMEADGLVVNIRNTFQAEGMMDGNEIDVEAVSFPVTDDVEYDGIIFDIDVSESSISMVFDVSERAMMDPTGVIGAGRFERYYISFEGSELVSATADESAGVVPTVEIVDGELLIEFSEGMELGDGKDALILIEIE